MSAASVAEVFQADTRVLDERFVQNTGGDGSNMLSRAIYELVPSVTEDGPTLDLELYTKYNDDISTQRELHGNIVLRAKLADLETLNMGYFFNSDPENNTWDGLMVTADFRTTSDYSVVFTGHDLSASEKPFASGVYPADLTKDSVNDWNITAEKSRLTCPLDGGRCTAIAHFNRKFATGDNTDTQLEPFKVLGYEFIGFYSIHQTG